jgi:hypothetical protein
MEGPAAELLRPQVPRVVVGDAGVISRRWTVEDLIRLLEEAENSRN